MIYLQQDSVEDLIRLRQTAMRTSREHDDLRAHSQATLIGLVLQKPSNLPLLVEILEQLVSEVAGARDAVEAERAMRRL